MTTKELREYLSISNTYIEDRRANGDWVERIHWIYLNPKFPRAGVRYFPELCLNWIYNQSNPKQHQAYCAEFQRHHKLTA